MGKTTAKHAKSKSARKHASKTVASAKKLVKLTHGMKPNRVVCRKVNGKKVCKMVFPKNKKVYKERAAKARAKYKKALLVQKLARAKRAAAAARAQKKEKSRKAARKAEIQKLKKKVAAAKKRQEKYHERKAAAKKLKAARAQRERRAKALKKARENRQKKARARRNRVVRRCTSTQRWANCTAHPIAWYTNCKGPGTQRVTWKRCGFLNAGGQYLCKRTTCRMVRVRI